MTNPTPIPIPDLLETAEPAHHHIEGVNAP